MFVLIKNNIYIKSLTVMFLFKIVIHWWYKQDWGALTRFEDILFSKLGPGRHTHIAKDAATGTKGRCFRIVGFRVLTNLTVSNAEKRNINVTNLQELYIMYPKLYIKSVFRENLTIIALQCTGPMVQYDSVDSNDHNNIDIVRCSISI